jgi:hypothetical protein
MASGSPLFAGYQAGGVFSVVDQSFTTGDVFFVSSTSANKANATGAGRSPAAPFATIDYAVGQCTASNGDVIYVMPYHAETVSAAAGLDLDVAGITVIGIGEGAATPTVTLDTIITADVDVDAAGITVRNIHFKANFADITAAIDVNADDFTLDRCRFSETATDMNALIWVQDAAAGGSDRITIKGCHAIALDAANTHFVNFAGTGTGHVITDNVLIGDWGTMAIGGAGVITACLIRDNLIYNATTSNDACVKLADTATGIVAFNHAGGGAAQANGFKADACAKSQNFYGDLIDASAILDPIAT